MIAADLELGNASDGNDTEGDDEGGGCAFSVGECRAWWATALLTVAMPALGRRRQTRP